MNHVRWLGLVCLAAGCASIQEENRRQAELEPFSDQAVKGAALFTTNCAKCHGALGQGTEKAPRVVDLNKGALPMDPPADREKRTMQFRTVADVAQFVVKYMPAKDPGSLSETDYFRILAFDLKANGIDLGDKHLDMELARTLEIPRNQEEPPRTSQR
jgi:cytochrome c